MRPLRQAEHFERAQHCGRAIFDAELRENCIYVLMDRVVARAEDGPDFRICFSLGNPVEHLRLAWS